MQQVLFRIPLSWLHEGWPDVPIYVYGLMLFLAFVFCGALAKRLCQREGIDPNLIPDLIIALFITGIVGGRVVFVIQYWHLAHFADRPFWNIIALWDGGLVLYGALAGATLGYFSYYHFVMRKHGVSNWKMLDVVAPCVALGVALGRIGCLCTGCCYGNVACESCPAIHFPLFSNTSPTDFTAPARAMITRGNQTLYGFIFKGDSLRVEAVEPGSPAAAAGLQAGDVIVQLNGTPVLDQRAFEMVTGPLTLMVSRAGATVTLPAFTPTSIGLHPTQIYESISMALLLFFLLSYYPYKRHDGELMVLFMFCYGTHRFLNEMLRTDTDPVAFGLTLSQNGSLLVIAGGAVLAFLVWRRPSINHRGTEDTEKPKTASIGDRGVGPTPA